MEESYSLRPGEVIRVPDNCDLFVSVPSIVIGEDAARVIVEMEAVCYSEGTGPDSNSLMAVIAEAFPELTKEFSYLPWDSYKK